MTADFVGNGRVLVEHQQRLHHQRPREHMHFRPHRLLDPCHPPRSQTRIRLPRANPCPHTSLYLMAAGEAAAAREARALALSSGSLEPEGDSLRVFEEASQELQYEENNQREKVHKRLFNLGEWKREDGKAFLKHSVRKRYTQAERVAYGLH